MKWSDRAGQNRVRITAILRNNSTSSIKSARRQKINAAQFIEIILYYISRVGLIESVLLKVTLPLGQNSTPTEAARS